MKKITLVLFIAVLLMPLNLAMAQPKPLAGKTIALDAGHGGYDVGAVNNNPHHRLFEKDMDISVVNLLKEKLEAEGAKVVLTRSGDEYVGLRERVARANASGADILISVHHNSARPGINGTETYFTDANDQRLAAPLQQALVAGLQTADRGIKHSPGFVLTKYPAMPSVITEASFVTQDAEAHAFRHLDRVQQEAEALHQGILAYYS